MASEQRLAYDRKTIFVRLASIREVNHLAEAILASVHRYSTAEHADKNAHGGADGSDTS